MRIETSGAAVLRSAKTDWWRPQLTGPLIAAAVIRLTLLIFVLARGGSSSLFSSDTSSYLDPGRNLLLHGRFVADGAPELFRTPGYPLFLAITSLAGVPVTAFIRSSVLAYLQQRFLVPNAFQVAHLEETLSQCLNEIQKLVGAKEKYYWSREEKFEAIEKRIEKLEYDIDQVFRNPPLLQNDSQNKIL